MILKKKLMELTPGQYIRIGTTRGSGFLYAGKVNRCNLPDIDEKIKADLKETAATAKNEKSRDSANERIKNYTPLASRAVVDTYPSTRTNANILIILIEGDESEKAKDNIKYFDDDFKVESYNDDGVKLLAGAITETYAEDLEIKYKEFDAALNDLMMYRQRFEVLREAMYETIEKMAIVEEYAKKFNQNVERLEKLTKEYCILEDPDSIIDGIRKKVFGPGLC